MTDPKALGLEGVPEPRALGLVALQTQAPWVWQSCKTKTPGSAKLVPGSGITHECHIQGA